MGVEFFFFNHNIRLSVMLRGLGSTSFTWVISSKYFALYDKITKTNKTKIDQLWFMYCQGSP